MYGCVVKLNGYQHIYRKFNIQQQLPIECINAVFPYVKAYQLTP